MSVNFQAESFREALPMHFLFKIQSFSLFSKNKIVRHESSEFETGGYKWKLVLYPNGNNTGKDHISLYLMLVNDSSTNSLPACWELNVFFKLFLFDQIRDRYLFQGVTEDKTRRFHETQKVLGFPKFVSLAKFNNPENGYLVHDTCVFGAEIFITKPPENVECLRVKEATTVMYTWKIENFSKINVESLVSGMFKAGDHNWKVSVYSKGFKTGKDNSISLYLHLVGDCEENPALKVLTCFKLRVKDQIEDKHIEFSEDNHWFHASLKSWGCQKFIGLSEMDKKENGYLVKDTCIVEAEVKVLAVVSKRPRFS